MTNMAVIYLFKIWSFEAGISQIIEGISDQLECEIETGLQFQCSRRDNIKR